MTKIIQPLSDPEDIREEANEQVKEKFTDFYVDAAAPDPLTFQAPAAAQPDPVLTTDPAAPTDAAANETAMDQENDPLNYQPLATFTGHGPDYAAAEAKSAQSNDPLQGA
ncbi:hypothetical protein EYC59_06280 [Candidatus Saccharibacteria bacterium]|nr:MAG: hypothetical protein EYC59_06280 [Candidatus Saccharibacteria bacterium]